MKKSKGILTFLKGMEKNENCAFYISRKWVFNKGRSREKNDRKNEKEKERYDRWKFRKQQLPEH